MPIDDRERLEQLFDDHAEVGLHHGSQLAVYVDGEETVTLAGGTTGPDGEPMTTDRRMVLFSCTKPLTAVAVHQLAEAGALDYDDRIVDYWPEFADEGTDKATVTVRHVLSHQGGFPVGEFDVRVDDWTDWDAVVAAMEDIDLQFEPGSTAAYHPMNYGWVLGELIRRVDGRPVGDYVNSEVLDPIGMDDTYLGLPDEIEDDVATLAGFEVFDRARDPNRGLEGDNEGAAANFNREDFHRAAMPAASAVGTARDMARFYACLANGGELDGDRLLDPETVDAATTLQIHVEKDATIGVARRYGLGFGLAGTATDNYGTLAPEGTFGHGGLGSSITWADPDAGLAVAYLTNGIREGYEQRARANAIGDAVRRTFADGRA
jgi:CubicO group peptidase (beta-lactamase class C family)